MTVEELIKELIRLPPTALVYREGGEYQGDERRVTQVAYRLEGGFGLGSNTVVIR